MAEWTESEKREFTALANKYHAIGQEAARCWSEALTTGNKLKNTEKSFTNILWALPLCIFVSWLADWQSMRNFLVVAFVIFIVYYAYETSQLKKRQSKFFEKVDDFAFQWATEFGTKDPISIDLRHSLEYCDDGIVDFYPGSIKFNRWWVNQKRWIYRRVLGDSRTYEEMTKEERLFQNEFGERL